MVTYPALVRCCLLPQWSSAGQVASRGCQEDPMVYVGGRHGRVWWNFSCQLRCDAQCYSESHENCHRDVHARLLSTDAHHGCASCNHFQICSTLGVPTFIAMESKRHGHICPMLSCARRAELPLNSWVCGNKAMQSNSSEHAL